MRAKHIIPIILCAISLGSAAWAQSDGGASRLPTSETSLGTFQPGLELGIQTLAYSGAFWNLGATQNPSANYNPNKFWVETYFKPSLSYNSRLNDNLSLYGAVSFIGSFTSNIDLFEYGNTGRFLIEQAFLGVNFNTDALQIDLSAGPQNFRLGTGMLLGVGGGNGFERGALVFGPRQAWANTAIAKFSANGSTLSTFYVDPNELASADTYTRIAGGSYQYENGSNRFLISYGKILSSEAPYPVATGASSPIPIAILPNGRSGMQFVYGATAFTPFSEALPGLFVELDGALEWKSQIAMRAFGWRAVLGYSANDLSFRPTFRLTYQTFSGDKPETETYERFDPLFYEGNPSAWATGTNSSFAFLNSNVNGLKASVDLFVSPQDILTLSAVHVRANELNSPIQFGQSTRLVNSGGVPNLLTGVQKTPLANDGLVQYTRVINANTYLTLLAAVSMPLSGLKTIAVVDNWYGLGANLVIRY